MREKNENSITKNENYAWEQLVKWQFVGIPCGRMPAEIRAPHRGSKNRLSNARVFSPTTTNLSAKIDQSC